MAQSTEFTYKGIRYTPLSYNTCEIKAGTRKQVSGNTDDVIKKYEYFAGNKVKGNLIIPITVYHSEHAYTVTSIGDYAFGGCAELTSINIPDSVTSIGDSAFCGCTRLTRVDIADLIAWYNISFKTLRSNPLYNAHHLFLNGIEITNLSIPNTVTAIGNLVFAGYSGLTSINIPSSVTSINSGAFAGCTGLTTINIPDSVTSIGASAFAGCTGLTTINIPDSVTSIGASAFSGCTGLTTINIPDSVTSIGNFAFSGCTGLTSIDIPDSVTSIGNSAFSGCTGLSSINIPDSVTSIGYFAFYKCTGLSQVIVLAKRAPSLSASSFTYDIFCNATLIIPTNSSGYDDRSNYWINFKEIKRVKTFENIKDENSRLWFRLKKPISPVISSKNTCELIAPQSGEVYTQKNIVIPQTVKYNDIEYTVTALADGAFKDCRNLSAIECNNITPLALGSDVFPRKNSNFTIYVPTKSVDTYKAQWASYKDYIKGLNFTVKGIQYHVLTANGACVEVVADNEKYIGNITIHKKIYDSTKKAYTVIRIGKSAFCGCTELTAINIPDSVTSIGTSAFMDCTGLTSIDIPDSVTSIGESAFCNCSGLTAINIPNSVTTIDESAFSGCTKLTAINIPDSVTVIGKSAFWDCSDCA